ncbi:hypothetical protein LAUMK191_01510 [Mycobacterium attenuatum]|nr:hypothetical protein LAUMK191_01510 [Mycobacterium attenuatum]
MRTSTSLTVIGALRGGAPDRYRLPVGVVNSAVCVWFPSLVVTCQAAADLTFSSSAMRSVKAVWSALESILTTSNICAILAWPPQP